MMTNRGVIELVAGIAVLIVVFLAGWEALREHDARLAAEMNVKAEQVKSDAISQQIKDSQDAQRRASVLEQQMLDKISLLDSQLKTPAQAVQQWPSVGPAGTQPIIIQQPATPSNPTPEPVYGFNAADFLHVSQQLLQCQAETVKLTACQKDAETYKQQVDWTGQQLHIAEQQRDEYKKALHGGTLMQRVKHDLVIALPAVGIGVALGYAAHK